VDTIYIEEEIAEHPRTQRICQRFPKARLVSIRRYSDVFNSRAQNFKAQKKNYYFSHMLNCVYDCRYCFLQGMYQSANYVVFVNTEDFLNDITKATEQHEEPSWFFSGYDCDSLALDPITHFVSDCLEHFSGSPNAYLELRTKSTQIRPLLNREPLSNVVVAYSLSPSAIVEAEELGTAPNSRLENWTSV